MATQVGELKYSVGFDVKKADLNTLKTQLQELQKLSFSDLMKINNSDRENAKQALRDITEQAQIVQKALNDAFNVKLNTVNIQTFNQSLKKSGSSIQQVYNGLKKGGVAGQNAFRSLVTQVTTANIQLKETHKFLDNIATTLGNTIKWNIASGAINTLSNSVQQAWGFVKSLDTSLNDIMIVTGKSADEMAKFSVQANETAKSLGKTTVDYTKAALIYAQQGLSDDQIAARAAITLKAANVTGQSTDAVSEQLTSVWNGYKVTAEEAELYVDRLAAVAANTASNLEQLSTGMSKVAAAAAAMGVGQDQLAAQLSTIISVTRQAPESVGTALRTVYARISDIKAGIDEDGVDLGRYSGKMAELGFNVLDVNGKLRDMGEVIEQIGGRWQSLTREQQVSLAQTMAGQRQYSNLIALFDNFEEYNRALGIAQNAAGTLQKQQDTYMERTRAHLNQLKAATENLYKTLLKPDSIEPLIDALSSVVSLASKFVDGIGGAGNLLISLGSIAFGVLNGKIAQGINTVITNFQIAQSNILQFQQTLKAIEQWQGIPNLDSFTKNLLDKRNDIMQLMTMASPQQNKALQSSLNSITEQGNRLKLLQAERDAINDLVQAYTKGRKTFNDITKDAEALDKFITSLGKRGDYFKDLGDNLVTYQKNLLDVHKAQLQTNADHENTGRILKETQNGLSVYMQKMQQAFGDNPEFKIYKEQLAGIQQQFEKIANSNLNTEQKTRAFEQLASKLKDVHDKAIEVNEQLSNRMVKGFNELPNKIKESSDAFELLKKQYNSLEDSVKRGMIVQSITQIASGVTQLASSINQLKNLGSIWAEKDASVLEKTGKTIVSIAAALPLLINGAAMMSKGLLVVKAAIVASSAASATDAVAKIAQATATDKATASQLAFNAALLANPLTWIIALLGAAAAAIAIYLEKAKKARQQQIKFNEAIIEEQNKKQEQIQNNKQLYNSIDELNKKYKDGQITRIELKSSIEDLIDQYGMQGQAIRSLAGDYDKLHEKIKEQRIADLQQGLKSAQTETSAAAENVWNEATKNNDFIASPYSDDLYWYLYNISPGSQFDKSDQQPFFKHLYNNWLSNRDLQDKGTDLYIRLSDKSDAEQILKIYENVENFINDVRSDTTITQQQKRDSEYYQGLLKWFNEMTPAITPYRDALKDAAKYQNELNILTSANNINLDTVKTANDYLIQREKIIDELKKKNVQQAETVADAYLKENYRQLFIQFDQISKVVSQIQNKTGKSNKEIEALLNTMDEEHLAWFMDNIDLKTIDKWEELEGIVKRLSNADLSNLSILKNAQDIDAATTAASDSYVFLQSLQDQVKSGKNISSKEWNDLAENGYSQLQGFFKKMANGTYKMVEDAEEFQNTVNSLKLQKFYDTIIGINAAIERNNELAQSGYNLKDLDRSNYSVETEVIGKPGRGREREITQVSYDFDTDLINKQIDALKIARSYDQKLVIELQQWEEDFKKGTQKQKVQIADAIQAAIQQQIQSGSLSNSKLEQLSQDVYEQIHDALFPTDADIDSNILESLKRTIQQLASQSEELDNSLEEDARAAEQVAQSILRFNNAIEDVIKNYETWLDVLDDENSSLQQIAQIIQPLRDAYADLLDIQGDSLSNEFLQSSYNLELMKQVIDGNIQKYEELRALVAQDIIAQINFDSTEAENSFWTAYNQITDWMNDNNFKMEIDVGANLDDDQLMTALTNIINATQMTAAQASDLLHDAFGINAEVVNETQPVETENTVTGFKTNVNINRIRTKNPLIGDDGEVIFPDITYEPIPLTTKTTSTVAGTALKIINARKASGGEIKWKHSSQGAGAAGVKYRTEAAQKAAKTTEKKIDTSTKDTKQPAKDTRDIYHDINIELKQIEKDLNRIQKVQDRLYGKQLIDNLNKQTDILEKQKVKLREKNELQKLDLAQKKAQLAALGATFDEYDHISNYLDLLGYKQGVVNGLVEQYKGIVSSYNATTDKDTKDLIKDQLSEVEKKIKKAEDDYKDLENAIKNYDFLYAAIADIQDEIDDAVQKQIELNITRFNMAIEVRLQMGQAQRDWNQFVHDVIESTDVLKASGFDNLLADATLNKRNAQSYFTSSGGLADVTQQINKLLKQKEQMDKTGWSQAYGNNSAKLKEDLETYFGELTGQMTNVKKLINDVHQAYLDMYDDIKDQMDEQLSDYQFMNDLIEHDIDLIQLLYGDKQYAAMEAFYDQQYQNQLNQIDFLRQSIALVEERMAIEEAAGNTEAVKKLKDQYKDLVSDLNSLVEASVKTLQDKYTAAIDQIFDTLDKRVTNGLGIDYLQMEWELINKNADEYLDTINSAYALQELQYKYQKAIDDTDNVKNQKVLTDLMNQQLNNLKAKEKLTQYDVDRAEKLLQIEQARMALEDTRSAKTSLRLKRDSQGNYSYVYAANEEDVSQAEDQLAKLQNELYNFDKNAYQKNLDDILSAWREFQNKYKEIVLDTSLSEEERVRQLALLRDQYGEYINGKAAENKVIRQNLMDSAFTEYAALYEGDKEAYMNMIQSETDALMEQLLPTWNNSVQQMTNNFIAQGGLVPMCEEGFRNLETAAAEYQNALKTLEQAAGTDFASIRDNHIDPTVEKFGELIAANDDLINKFRNEQIPAVDALKNAVDELLNSYSQVWENANNAANAAKQALDDYRKVMEAYAQANENYKPAEVPQSPQSLPSSPQSVAPEPVTPISGGSGIGSDNSGATKATKETSIPEDMSEVTIKSIAEGIAGNMVLLQGLSGWFADSDLRLSQLKTLYGEPTASKLSSQIDWWLNANGGTATNKTPSFYAQFDYESLLRKRQQQKRKNPKAILPDLYDTGGYTGAWGPEGRWALLHQKQLVLNAQDTKNILNTVSILRGVISTVGGNISAKLGKLGNEAILPVVPKGGNDVQQAVSIQASFPNVNSKREIEEAFSELVNMAAQRALRRR